MEQICYLMKKRPMKNDLVSRLPVKNPSICALYAGGFWKGNVLVAPFEELETMDASEMYSTRLNAKEVIFPKKGELFFLSQMDESEPLEEIET